MCLWSLNKKHTGQCIRDKEISESASEIESPKEDGHKAKRISRPQSPSTRKSPTVNTEETTAHPTGPTKNVPMNDAPAADEMDANPSDAAENATIEVDTQGDTAEDPIIIKQFRQ